MTDKLFIIGNGFDLYHGLKTMYSDFRDYIVKKKSGLWNLLHDVYGDTITKDMWWSNFEEMLGHVNYMNLLESNNGIPPSPSKVKNLLKGSLPPLFGEWINKMDANVQRDENLKIDETSLFFSFNYTLLLEKVYGVKDENIWHIHNSVMTPDDIVVGHDSDDRILFSRWNEFKKENNIDFNWNDIIDNINRDVANNAKKVNQRIEINKDRFYELYSGIKHFVVMGFSFNDIDMPYIEKIIGVNENISKVEWKIYYHIEGENEAIIDKLLKLGVNRGSITNPVKW